MSPHLLLLLAGAQSPSGRRRRALLASAVAVAGGLLIAAIRVLAMPGLGGLSDGINDTQPRVSTYIGEAGLRPGVALAILLLSVPLLALAFQTIQIGEAERRRRLDILRWAGASRRQARSVSAADAGTAGALGGLAAGPAYLLLWLLLGVLPAPDHRLLPWPQVADLGSWAAVVLLATLVTGLAAAAMSSRSPRAQGRTGLRLLVAGLSAAAAIVLATLTAAAAPLQRYAVAAVVLALTVVAALALGRVVVRRSASIWARRPGGVPLLSASKLLTEPAGAGRVAAVLLLCGLSVGITAALLLLSGPEYDDQFLRSGATIALAATLCAGVVAMISLAVGAAEQLVDEARTVAALHAFGVDHATLLRVQRQSLSVAATPAATIGVCLGSGVYGAVLGLGAPELVAAVLVLTASTAVVTHLLCAGAVHGLRRRSLIASDPANLHAV